MATNGIKYTTGPIEPGCMMKGGMLIANNTVNYPPGFYTGITPGASGYTIYLNKSSNGPSIYTAANDADLISLTKEISGQTFTGATGCLNWFATQTDKICVNRDYEGIVTSGLSLNLDAGFTPSYPTTGTTWYDIGSSGNNGTLINGPTFSSATGGSIVFDGVDDFSNFSSNINFNDGSPFTAQCFIDIPYFTGQNLNRVHWISGLGGNSMMIFSSTGFRMWNEAGGLNDLIINYAFPTNKIFQATITRDSNNIVSLYVNGTYINQGSRSGQFRWTTIARLGSSTLYCSRLSLYNMMVYEKALSSTEVLQNYQALFPRFLGKNIVTSGLIEYLDVGYSTSYGGTGTIWNNVAGTAGGTGTLVNGPAYNSNNGGSIVFDGIDDYVNIPNSSLTQFPVNSGWSFTISSEMISLNSPYPSILNKGNSGTTGILVFYSSGGNIWFKHNNSQPTSVVALMNAPFQYTVTYGGGAVKIYLNGSYRNNGPVIASVDTTSNLSLAAGDSYSNIKIYDFMKYDRQLSDQEILQNYQVMLPRFLNTNIITNGLIEYLDAGYMGSYPITGTTWYNVAGTSAGNATLNNGPTYSSSNGGILIFDSVDDYGTISTTIDAGSVNTVCAFVKLDGQQNQPSGAGLVGSSIYTPLTNGADNWLGFTGDKLYFFATESNDVNNFNLVGTTSLDTTNTVWYYITSVINGNSATIYLNGVLENTVTKLFTIGSWTSQAYIGGRGLGRLFKGSIANISVYNRALSQTEILQNYNAQKSRFGL